MTRGKLTRAHELRRRRQTNIRVELKRGAWPRVPRKRSASAVTFAMWLTLAAIALVLLARMIR